MRKNLLNKTILAIYTKIKTLKSVNPSKDVFNMGEKESMKNKP